MEPIHEFSLATHDGPYEQWPERTPLLRLGQPTGAQLQGYVIEAQYRCAHGIVIITSHDFPFEESNDFFLLSDEYTLLAHAQLSVPYGSYLLHAHWPIDAVQLRLHYHTRLSVSSRRPAYMARASRSHCSAKVPWRVTLAPAPR